MALWVFGFHRCSTWSALSPSPFRITSPRLALVRQEGDPTVSESDDYLPRNRCFEFRANESIDGIPGHEYEVGPVNPVNDASESVAIVKVVVGEIDDAAHMANDAGG